MTMRPRLTHNNVSHKSLQDFHTGSANMPLVSRVPMAGRLDTSVSFLSGKPVPSQMYYCRLQSKKPKNFQTPERVLVMVILALLKVKEDRMLDPISITLQRAMALMGLYLQVALTFHNAFCVKAQYTQYLTVRIFVR